MSELGFALFIAAILGFVLGMKYLQNKKQQKEREILHRERMLAIEKGIPLPELPAPGEDSSLLNSVSKSPKYIIPKLSLGCGLISMCLGLGLIAAFHTAPPESEVAQFWTLGFIPLLLGFGFLLYSILYYLLFRKSNS